MFETFCPKRERKEDKRDKRRKEKKRKKNEGFWGEFVLKKRLHSEPTSAKRASRASGR